MLWLFKCKFIKHVSKFMTASSVNKKKKEKEVQWRLRCSRGGRWGTWGFLQQKLPSCGWMQEPWSPWHWGWDQRAIRAAGAVHIGPHLLKSAPSGRTPVFPLAMVFLSCGASVDTIALFFSSLNSARPSLERELCYYLRNEWLWFSCVVWGKN